MNSRAMSPILVCAIALCAGLHGTTLESSEASKEGEHLAPYQKLVGGQWRMGSSYQTFEWGVGKLSVKSRQYVDGESQPILVSEGTWFWHPGASRIKGFFTAVDMPVLFFDYTTEFDGNVMRSELVAYEAEGRAKHYVEELVIVNELRLEWKLFAKTGEGLDEVMNGTYTREQKGQGGP